MAPKSKTNKSNPEKHAELNENWANNLPLKYDDHACSDSNEIVVFAQQFALSIRAGNSTFIYYYCEFNPFLNTYIH
jgi:hypothetical protein